MLLDEARKLISIPTYQKSGAVTWADLGCGSGLFTRALADQLSPGSTVYGVDNENLLEPISLDNDISIIPIQADFIKSQLPFKNLDGILMANSLHYVQDKVAFIGKMKQLLKSQAAILIVEYDTARPVPVWVPYPVKYISLTNLFSDAGYRTITKLGTYPSRFGGQMYAALIGE